MQINPNTISTTTTTITPNPQHQHQPTQWKTLYQKFLRIKKYFKDLFSAFMYGYISKLMREKSLIWKDKLGCKVASWLFLFFCLMQVFVNVHQYPDLATLINDVYRKRGGEVDGEENRGVGGDHGRGVTREYRSNVRVTPEYTLNQGITRRRR